MGPTSIYIKGGSQIGELPFILDRWEMAKGYGAPLLLVEKYMRDRARVFPLHNWSSCPNIQ